MNNDSKMPPLERYTRILELLTSFPDGLGLTEVARMLALPKTSAHRLLGTMQGSQLVDLVGGGAYVLGARVRRLASANSDTEWVANVVRPHIADLAKETDEACYLAKLHVGHSVSSVLIEAPDTPWRGFVLPGRGMAPHAAASAKAILAFQPRSVIDAALGETLPRLTRNTCVDPTKIREEYARVRELGFATCLGEIDEELAAVGVPIHGAQGSVIYSLGVTGPLKRLEKKGVGFLAEIMTRYARRIEDAMNTGALRKVEVE